MRKLAIEEEMHFCPDYGTYEEGPAIGCKENCERGMKGCLRCREESRYVPEDK